MKLNALERPTNMRVLSSVLFVGLLLSGCQSPSKLDSGDFHDFLQRASRSRKHSGDFGAFFVQQVSRYGGQARGSEPGPELRGTWYSESDSDGFGAQLYDMRFARVESFMESVYGPPLDLSTNLDTPAHGLYAARQIGVAIQFFANTNGVGFICVRGRNR